MSGIVQYISLAIGGIAFASTTIQHVFHRSTNKSQDIQHTIKLKNLDQNIQNIKGLFQKLINKDIFSNEAKDLENQVENIVPYDYDNIKETVQNEKMIDRQTITKISNALALSQNIQNHINQQTEQVQTSNNQLSNERKTLLKKKKLIKKIFRKVNWKIPHLPSTSSLQGVRQKTKIRTAACCGGLLKGKNGLIPERRSR
ncbi:hypothetical protein ABPG72_012101 [Tetrahymena utriculariae]